MSASAGAIALAQAVGGDVKVLTAQLLAKDQEVANLTSELNTAKTEIQTLKERLDAMSNPPPS